MNTKTTSILIGIVLILGVGGLVYSMKNADSEPAVVPTDTTTNSTDTSTTGTPANAGTTGTGTTGTTAAGTTTGTAGAGGYTTADVAAHNSKSSCWSIINGNVYDLTSWIPKHPGGENAILQLCGTDGSAKFNGQHGGAAKQAGILAGFKIGVAAK